jgi:DNA helicase IV
MKTLKNVKPKPEHLKLITHVRPGVRVVRGAAGSGKTTTAVLMLKTALAYLLDVYAEEADAPVVNVKVFTFNKTLSGYVTALVRDTFSNIPTATVNLEITTLGKYLYHKIPDGYSLLNENEQTKQLQILYNNTNIPLTFIFLNDEVNYLSGRLKAKDLEAYMQLERTGRGAKPRVGRHLKRRILDEIVFPYMHFKKQYNYLDWNDLAEIARDRTFDDIDIVVIDEAQDFSANQLGAILNQLSTLSITTIVLDSAQQIYKRSFTWKDIGVIQAEYFKLERNYRNTFQIANLAVRLLQNANILLDEDATLPILSEIARQGERPIVLQGRFDDQMTFIVNFIMQNINLENQSIGFLHPKGYGWFKYVIQRLNHARIPFVSISKENVWPQDNTNVALSTIHSAKGLEFDFVFIVGLEEQHFNLGEGDSQDSDYTAVLKLIAMGITRAKENVILSYRKDTMPSFLSHLDPQTYRKVIL